MESVTFEEANKKEHPVEKEWHYPLLIQYGFVPETLSAIGFVRHYVWQHPERRIVITFNIGVNQDYWKNWTTKDEGYWYTLEDYLKKLTLVDNQVN